MDKQCEIVQDLLPLYVDGACSPASTEMIQEHLLCCAKCRAVYDRLCADTGENMLKQEMGSVVAKHGQRMKRRKILTIGVSVLLTLCLIFACVRLWPSNIDYGSSQIYSRQDMDEAVRLIQKQFNKWRGCKLYSISYTDDAFCQRELDYCNSLADDGITYTQCIVFRTRFRSPVFGGGGWNANFVYNWSWYLARTDGGDWELLTWGAP